ncbi:hypothetical protein HDA32_004226 [Spinactinospora alkalitolerans]|uniref:Uncharacterized protein n=1 Tax=Spinactinospora alkalitolerans TaxID=687207 RepID=A0A852TX73_9ACTN|nr:hypothetical protein [Spinactinospora alkalitolerans]NYE49106.1 hypothetical protein [Spinactinospora alkalitolerans]
MTSPSSWGTGEEVDLTPARPLSLRASFRLSDEEAKAVSKAAEEAGMSMSV